MFDTLITTKELVNHLQDERCIIFDVRFNLAEPDAGRAEYLKAHIPGSQFLHLDEDLSSPIIKGVTGRHPLPDAAAFEKLLRTRGVDNDHQVIVYDHGHGGIAARLWWMLRWLGHEAVAVLDGGWAAWIADDLPVDDLIPQKDPGNFSAIIDNNLIRLKSDVDRMRQDPESKVVDARTENRYLGKEEPIDPIAGSIKGAVNKPWPSNLNDKGRWKSPDALREEWESVLQDIPATNTVCYCGSGVTACHDILSIKHAGLGDALLYPGSWSEYLIGLQD